MMKMDGLSIRATYEDGKLQRLETRGDGIEEMMLPISRNLFAI